MPTDEDMREELVRLGRQALSRAKLPAGFNAVIVITDSKGAWVAVSSTDDAYTYQLLRAALEGAGKRTHRAEPIQAEGSDAPV